MPDDESMAEFVDRLFHPTKFKVIIPRIERIVEGYDEDDAGETFLHSLTLDDLESIGRPWPQREDPDDRSD